MKNSVADILQCYDYGEDGWDEDLIKDIKRRVKRGKPDWARQWYLNQIKEDGSFGFSSISAGFWFAEWIAKEGLKLVDWSLVGRYIIATIAP